MASVDKIVVDQNGVTKTFTPTTWKELVLTDRVDFIRSATFFAGSIEVPAREAIVQLRSV
jgi:hypothetical protein